MTKKQAGKILTSSLEARKMVLTELVPLAIDTLRRLLVADDEKIRYMTAMGVMEIPGVKERKTSSEAPVQIHLSGDKVQTVIGGFEKLKEAKVRNVEKDNKLPDTSVATVKKRANKGK